MTVASETARNDYIGSGTTGPFAYSFRILAAADLVVTKVDASGVATDLTITTDYSVTGVGSYAGGSVTLVTALAVGETLTLRRVVTVTQEANLPNQGGYFPNVVERALDRLTFIAQQLKAQADRAIRIPDHEALGDAPTVPSATSRALKYLAFDADGNPIAATASAMADIELSEVYVDRFGAVGDGLTDDTAAVQAAIAACPSGGTVHFSGDKHYYLRSLGTITKPLTIDGGGCRVTCDITSSGVLGAPLFGFSGTIGTDIPCTGAVAQDAMLMTATTPADAGTLAVGDWVRLACDDVPLLWDGSGPANAGIREINRVSSVDAGTGQIGLQYPVINGFSVNPRLAKLDVIVAPIVRNFSSISEVDPAGDYNSSSQFGSSAPNIVDFFCTVGALAEGITVDGWNLIAFSTAYSIDTTFSRCRGNNPFRPETGGMGVVHKLWYSRNIHVTLGRGVNCRHIVDWSQCVDSQSSYCVDVTYDVLKTVTTSAYMTHGVLNRRISSYRDTAINKQGWNAGNYIYSTDDDVLIESFNHFANIGSITAITVTGGARNVKISNCHINTTYNGIKIERGATRTRISGGTIISGGTAIWSQLGATVYPIDVIIEDCDITGGDDAGKVAVDINATGDVVIRGNSITGQVCLRTGDQVASTSNIVEYNKIITRGGESASAKLHIAAFIPADNIRIIGNNCYGTTSGASISFSVPTTFVAEITGNTSHDQADVVSCTNYSAMEITLNNGRMWGNSGDTSDSYTFKTNAGVQVPNGTSGGWYIFRENIARWRFAMNNGAETGSDAGSDLQIQAFDDNGVFIDAPISAARASTGSVNINRRQLIVGSSSLTATATIDLRAAAGQHKDLQFLSGSLSRWRARCNNTAESGSDAGSDLQFIAYDDAGTQIDVPLSITRAASGQIQAARQLRTTKGRIVQTRSITSAGTTTGLDSTDDFVVVTGSSTHTITLMACGTGRRLFIKNRSTGTVTVNRLGSDTIDGGTTFNLTAGQGTTMVGNGTDWCRVANA